MEKNQIKKIRIKGFRSIKDQEIELENMNVLIGEADTGKSNLFMAFTLLQEILKQRLGLYSAQRGAKALLRSGKDPAESISMEFVFGDGNAYGFELRPTEDDRLFVQREYFSDGKMEAPISGGPHMNSQWRNASGSLAESVKPVLEANRWFVYHFVDAAPEARVKSVGGIVNNACLLPDGSNLAAFLLRLKQGYPQEYQRIVGVMRMADRDFQDFYLEPQELNEDLIRFRWPEQGSNTPMGAAQMSDSMLRFACLATLLMQPDKLKPATIIIDEPDLGLGFHVLNLVYEMIRVASHHSQIILATQSADLLDGFEPEEVVVADKRHGETSFRRQSAKNLKAWLEDDYTLGELWKKGLLDPMLS